jgi:hypothetical protein
MQPRTVTKASVTPAHNTWVTEKIRHQHGSGRWIYVDDGILRHPHVAGLRHAWLF